MLHAEGVRAATYERQAFNGETFPICSDVRRPLAVNSFATHPTISGAALLSMPTTVGVVAGDVFVLPGAAGAALVLSASPTTVDIAWSGLAALPVGATTVVHLRPIQASVRPHAFNAPVVVGKRWTHALWAFSRLAGASSVYASFSAATIVAEESAQLVSIPVQTTDVNGLAAHHLGTLLRQLIPIEDCRGWLLRVGITWKQALGAAVLELVGADSDAAQPNRPGFHAGRQS
jgi:hypothetical protein